MYIGTYSNEILTSARYQPKGIFLVAGLLATQIEKRDIMNDAKSVNKCAASVAIAKLFDNTPPEKKKKEICGYDYCLLLQTTSAQNVILHR